MPVARESRAALVGDRRGRVRVLLRQQHDLLPAARMRARHLPSAAAHQRRRGRPVRGVLSDRLHDPADQPLRASSAQPHRSRALRLLPAAPVALAEDLLDLLPADRILLGDHSRSLSRSTSSVRSRSAAGGSRTVRRRWWGFREFVRDIAKEPIGRVWPQVLFTFALQALLWWGLALDWTGWLACYWAFGVNWSSLQYTDHAWSPRARARGRLEPAVLAAHPGDLPQLQPAPGASPARRTSPGSICRAIVRKDDPNPTFWSIYWRLWAGAQPAPPGQGPAPLPPTAMRASGAAQ